MQIYIYSCLMRNANIQVLTDSIGFGTPVQLLICLLCLTWTSRGSEVKDSELRHQEGS